MTDLIRRLVSGNKARLRDDDLNIELDLVYVTPQIIIMGFPAAGVEGFYRNKRSDALRFLDTKHPSNYWVFNFCPLKENKYDSSVFHGRVSRYPFPDHHAPPLALLPLIAREMNDWLSPSQDRVAVLHCKAGKGRSGTMACAYLLARDVSRSPTTDPHARAQSAIDTIPYTNSLHSSASSASISSTSSSSSILPGAPLPATLSSVLDLHTSRRMKPAKHDEKQKAGVSIPSQRRWLHYWALILAGQAPTFFWAQPSSKNDTIPRVRITQIVVRMHTMNTSRKHLIRAANIVLTRTAKAAGSKVIDSLVSTSHNQEKSQAADRDKEKEQKQHRSELVWASLARYDDDLVSHLERLEKSTQRNSSNSFIGDSATMKDGGNDKPNASTTSLFDPAGTWDSGKMVTAFARLSTASMMSTKGTIDNGGGREQNGEEGKEITSYFLHPSWDVSMQKQNGATDIGETERVKANEPDIGSHAEVQKVLTAEDEADKAKIPREEVAPENDELADADNIPTENESNANHDQELEDMDIIEHELKDESIEDDVQTAGDVNTRAQLQQQHEIGRKGVIVDPSREIRVKLYTGQIFMGWFWFIPAFHMPPPPFSSPASTPSLGAETERKVSLVLTRKEVDFPLAMGRAVIDVAVDMEWM